MYCASGRSIYIWVSVGYILGGIHTGGIHGGIIGLNCVKNFNFDLLADLIDHNDGEVKRDRIENTIFKPQKPKNA